MTIQPKQLLEFAKARLDSLDEIETRAAISRAYYCAYHSLYEVTVLVPAVDSDDDDYIAAKEMLHRLAAWNVAKWPSLGAHKDTANRASREFRALRDQRTRADYNLDAECTGKDLELCVERASELKTASHELVRAIRTAQEH